MPAACRGPGRARAQTGTDYGRGTRTRDAHVPRSIDDELQAVEWPVPSASAVPRTTRTHGTQTKSVASEVHQPQPARPSSRALPSRTSISHPITAHRLFAPPHALPLGLRHTQACRARKRLGAATHAPINRNARRASREAATLGADRRTITHRAARGRGASLRSALRGWTATRTGARSSCRRWLTRRLARADGYGTAPRHAEGHASAIGLVIRLAPPPASRRRWGETCIGSQPAVTSATLRSFALQSARPPS